MPLLRLTFRAILLLSTLLAVGVAAKFPWDAKSSDSWTAADAERILFNSPWAQPAEATFPDPRDRDPLPAETLPGPAQAGMAGTRGVSDGRWDGGIGKNNGAGLPTLQVLVRWDSAFVVREAVARMKALGKPALGKELSPDESSIDYVITISGLVPTDKFKAPASLDRGSSSDDSTVSSSAAAEQLLENFMANSALSSRSGQSVRPHNAQVSAETGAVRLFFPRSLSLQVKDKEAYFTTRYGTLTVKKRFRLSDMLYKGKLEL